MDKSGSYPFLLRLEHLWGHFWGILAPERRRSGLWVV